MTALILAVALTAPPDATPVDTWQTDWTARVEHVGDLTLALVDEWRQLSALRVMFHPPQPAVTVRASVPRPTVRWAGGVEQWRTLVAAYFPADRVDAALTVIACESHGNPYAQHLGSLASGLFQAMPQWYTGVGWFEPSPFGAFDPFDPSENVRFAAWLSEGGADWSHWVCRP
jgi:hypothetical protein